jgi:hypothetical protein
MQTMQFVQRSQSPRWLLLFCNWVLGLGAIFAATLFLPRALLAQEEQEPTAYLQSFTGYGMRAFVGNRWGGLQLNAVNPTSEDREVFVTIFNTKDQVDQYCKKVWVPANSRITTWLPFFAGTGERHVLGTHATNSGPSQDALGPPGLALAPPSEAPLDIRAWVVDVRDGVETPVPTQTGENFVEIRIPLALREQRSAILHDHERTGPESKDMVYEAMVAMRVATRNTRRISELVPGEIPVDSVVLGTFDNILIATDDIFRQTGFIEALKGWLLKGGQLWLMLDKVSPDVAQQILGDCVVMEWVDDTSMNSFTLEAKNDPINPATELFHEDPVTQRRVLLNGGEVEMEINGWPALFWLPYGRGKIMVTTLEARGWVRKFSEQDVVAGMGGRGAVNEMQRQLFQQDFVLIDPMKSAAEKFVEGNRTPAPAPIDSRQFAADQIGYSIPSRFLIGSVLFTFCIVLAGSGWYLMSIDRASLMLGLSPILALVCGGVLYGVGAANRQQAPETLSELQFVRVVNGSTQLDMESTGTVYVTSGEERKITSSAGDLVHLQRTEANNEYRRMIWSDDHVWDLDHVVLPAGQSYIAQPTIEQIERPVRVSATFDPSGLKGTLDIPGVVKPTDGVIVFEKGFAPVRFEGANAFRVDAEDSLALGQFISSDVLSDQQRQHQEFYRQMFIEKGDWEAVRPLLFFWDDVRPISVTIPGVENHTGAAFYSVPLTLSKPEAGTSVRIPQSLLQLRTGSDALGNMVSPLYSWRSGEWVESKSYSTVFLRFRIPDALLPIRLDRVKLSIDLQAEDRAVEFATLVDGELSPLKRVESPREAFTFEVEDPASLSLNPKNEWVFALKVDRLLNQTDIASWKINDVKIEMSGETVAETAPKSESDNVGE